MPKCPTCKGRGKVKCEIHADGKVSHMDLPCSTCHGKKNVTQATIALHERIKQMWCRCKKSSGSSYSGDGPGHHWTCNDCGKVTQVG